MHDINTDMILEAASYGSRDKSFKSHDALVSSNTSKGFKPGGSFPLSTYSYFVCWC